MNTTNDTMLLTVLYRELPSLAVELRIEGHNAPEMALTILHESIYARVSDYDLQGHMATPPFPVQDNESITVLARRGGDIVAVAVFQVQTWHIEGGYVLRPVALVNALVDQCDETLTERATKRSLSQLSDAGLLIGVEAVLDMTEVAR